MSLTIRNVKKKPSSSFLNIETYVKASGLIVVQPDGDKTYIGRAYRMSPLTGNGGDFISIVQNVFRTMPEDSVLQCNLHISPDLDAPAIYKMGKVHGGPLIQELVERECALLAAAAEPGWRENLPLLNIRQVDITLISPVANKSDTTLDEQLQIQDDFLKNIRACGFFDAVALTAEQLVAVIPTYADIFARQRQVHLDGLIEVKQQVFGPDNTFDFRDSTVGVFDEKTFVAGVTCKAFPHKPTAGLMNLISGGPFNKGAAKDGAAPRIATPCVLSTTIRIANQRQEKERLDRAIESRAQKNPLPFKLGSEDPQTKLEDLRLLKAQSAGDDNKIVYVAMNCFFYGRSRSEAYDAASVFAGTLNKLDFNARVVRDDLLVRWAQTLPLNFSPKIAKKLECEAVMTAASAGYLLAVYGDCLGNVRRSSKRTGVPLITRRGNLMLFDPFVTDKSAHGLIAADTGSGKSVHLQRLIKSFRADGDTVVLFDNDRSAKKFIVAAQGEFNEFGASKTFNAVLNPFTGLDDEDFRDQAQGISSLLLLMCYDGEEPERGASIAMLESVTAAWAMSNNRATIDTTVVEALESIIRSSAEKKELAEHEVAARNLVPRLKAFVESPTRGKFFAGVGTISHGNPLTAYDVGLLGDDSHLKKCVMFFALNSLMTRLKNVEGRKVVLIDEGLDFLGDPTANAVAEGIYLKGRKNGIAAWFVVQSIARLAQFPAGPTIIKQSTWKHILAQDHSEIEEVIRQDRFSPHSTDPFFSRYLKSVETERFKFSEVMIIGPKFYEIGRIYLDKLMGEIYNSESESREKVFAMMEAGVPALDAVLSYMGDQSRHRQQSMRELVDMLRGFEPLSDEDLLNEFKEALS